MHFSSADGSMNYAPVPKGESPSVFHREATAKHISMNESVRLSDNFVSESTSAATDNQPFWTVTKRTIACAPYPTIIDDSLIVDLFPDSCGFF